MSKKTYSFYKDNDSDERHFISGADIKSSFHKIMETDFFVSMEEKYKELFDQDRESVLGPMVTRLTEEIEWKDIEDEQERTSDSRGCHYLQDNTNEN